MLPSPSTPPPRRLSLERVSLAAPGKAVLRSFPSRDGSASSFPVVSHGCGGGGGGGGGVDPWGSEATRVLEGEARSRSNSFSTTVAYDDATAPFGDFLPSNLRLPPRPSDLNEPAVSPLPSREPSPSRLSSLASPLARIATVKHARSLSSPMGFSGSSSNSMSNRNSNSNSNSNGNSNSNSNNPAGLSPRPGAANLLATIFKTPEATPQSTPEKKKLFGFNLPSSPMAPLWLSRAATAAAPGGVSVIIDEFAGIQFSAVLRSYLEEPVATGTPSTPADALMRSPEGRLEQAVGTATDLLDRVYAAYRSRTAALGDAVGELDAQRDELASHKALSRSLQAQLDRLVAEEREARETQSLRLDEQQRRIRELEAELLQERRRREASEEELSLARRSSSRCKRTSAASDSGFESDVDSILSRSDARTSGVVSPTDEGEADHAPATTALATAAAVGAETKYPTPLREAWRPESSNSSGASKPGVWGFFKSRQQQAQQHQHHQHQQQQDWEARYRGDIESVRMENRWLRERVREQERAIEGALDAIAGRGI